MKVYCTLCYKKWDASKHIDKKNYICPHCDWKIKRNIPIKLGGKKGRDKRLYRVRDLHALPGSQKQKIAS